MISELINAMFINSFEILDNLIVFIYFAVVLLIGLFFSKREKNTAEDYFLANRNMGWIAIGFSIFATNISSEHLVGLAGAGVQRGIAVGHFEWLAIIFILVLAWLFTPIILKSQVVTIPELIGRKFGITIQRVFSGLSIFTYIFTKIAITLFAGGILLNKILGWNFGTTIIILLLFTGLYTIVGGLRSVMLTQIFQTIVIIAGGIFVFAFGIYEIGGISVLFEKIPNTHWEIFKPLNDPDFPWLGILFGAPILAAWYWWADQYIVQRVLSAKDEQNGKKGVLLSAGLKTFPFLFLIFPGLIVLSLYPDIESNSVYPYIFESNILPIGIKGLVISGFFAAIMSSLASAFNSTATLIAYDFFKSKDNNLSDERLILIGRLSTIFIVFFSILFIPILNSLNNGIYVNLQSLQAYISPPIVVIFLLGLFWKKASSTSTIVTLLVGEALGLLRILYDFGFLHIDNTSFFNFFFEINYLYFATFLFIVSATVFVVITFLIKTKADNPISAKAEYLLTSNKINN